MHSGKRRMLAGKKGKRASASLTTILAAVCGMAAVGCLSGCGAFIHRKQCNSAPIMNWIFGYNHEMCPGGIMCREMGGGLRDCRD